MTPQLSTEKTVFPSGCSLRWDVATKSRLVKTVVNTNFTSKQDERTRIANWASEYNVTSSTIKAWVKKYRTTYETTQYAIPGTKEVSNTIITGAKRIESTQIILAKLRKQAKEAIAKVASSQG